jgi:hypothetical protein
MGAIALATPLLAVDGSDAQQKTGPIQFNRDIRPIFSDNCYACHGPDHNKRKAGLRLDRKDEAFKELESGGFAIVPGNPSQSQLYRLVTTSDEDDRMPPIKTGKHLSQSQKLTLRTWIQQGASWEEHWSYNPLKRPNQPAVKHSSWPSNPIDEFILSRLEAENLTPAGDASKVTLLRRLSFDLTGLPPSPEDAADFLSDPSDRAYERLVDRILSLPQYGERMAAHWLDLVRYADTDGFHADNYRSVYPYRDYVIAAFNQNMPFDRFTIEQIAGDLIPDGTQQQKIASTYNRLNRTTEEGGSQPKEYLAKYAADRVRTTSSVWLGATMGCAECHDHKFDPFTTKDFYSLAAFFADIKEVGVGKPAGTPLPTPAQEAELDRLGTAITAIEQELTGHTNHLSAAQKEWETGTLGALDQGHFDWVTIKPVQYSSEGNSTLVLREDLSIAVEGTPEDAPTHTILLATDRTAITGIRIETTPGSETGDAPFRLTGVEVEAMSGKSIAWERLKLVGATASSQKDKAAVAAAIDGKSNTGWSPTDNLENGRHLAAFGFEKPVSGGAGTQFRVRLKQESKDPNQGRLQNFRLSLATVPHPDFNDHGLPVDIQKVLRLPTDQRSEKEQQQLVRFHIDFDARTVELGNQLAAARGAKAEFEKSLPTTLATVSVEPRTMRVLNRGNWMDESGQEVLPAVPEFLAGKGPRNPNERQSRLDLAEWLVSDANPTAARSFVNRLWKICFGYGLSRVLDDLGSQGEWPTHPELLDWLAFEFKSSGWNVKHVLKQIVLSHTYRQSSIASAALRERDPYNRLYARQSRFRLEAEMIRDSALAVSGLLATEMGGRSVKPYQPEGYWQHLNFPKRTYQADEGDNLYRRGLYTFLCRTFPHPSLVAFDAPSREECTANRVISNNPLQALVLLNDPTYVEAARSLAQRTLQDSTGTFRDQLDRMFRFALTRSPTDREVQELADLHAEQLARYGQEPEAAARLIAVGEHPVLKNAEPAQLAAWTSVARVVLNLHEFITRY